jgi:hypothetical protein
MAGFQVTLYGRIWVTPEGLTPRITVLEGQLNGGRRERLNALLARQKLTAGLLQPCNWHIFSLDPLKFLRHFNLRALRNEFSNASSSSGLIK